MSVKLTEQEAWEMIAGSHTGILTTLRRDGSPISLPMWFAAIDGRIYMRTMASSKKALRIKKDSRACFMVESGKAWVELAAVVVPARASLVSGEEAERALAAIASKYEGFGVPTQRVPDATRQHYNRDTAVIRLDPAGPMITWNNAKLRMPAAEASGPRQ